MNCIEVGELMQRQLDLDLNEQETLQLETHLAQCKSCKMMFERLSMLSTQLAQLPHVTPPFSIVDSIMPQLLEIDQQKEVPSFLNNKEEAAHVEQWTPKRHTRFSSKQWKVTISGLVAATVLLTIGITNMNKHLNSDTDSAAVMTAFDYAAQMDNAESFRASDHDISTMDQSSVLERGLQNQLEELKPTSSMSIDHLTKSPPIEEGIASGQSSGMEMADRVVEQEYGATDALSGEKNVNADQNTEWLPDEATDELGFMSIMETHFEDMHLSPDSRFYLMIEEHSITVYDFNTNESIKTFAVPIEGEIVFNGWHEESIEFYIEVTDEQLQTHQLSFVMEQ